jgi:hypothetical protein
MICSWEGKGHRAQLGTATANQYPGPEAQRIALPTRIRTHSAEQCSGLRPQCRAALNGGSLLLDCIRSRRLTVASPEVMYRSMNICLAADICERLQRNLKFDLHQAEFVGDAEANRMRSRAMRPPYTI